VFRSILICLAAALAGIVSLIVFSTNDAGQQQRGTMVRWSAGGSPPRFALVFTPRAEQRAAKHPLVIAFHGYGDTAAKFSSRMHIQTLWPEAIVVYPQGWATSTVQDSAPSSTGWQGRAGEFGDRDLEFFDAIVATMKRSQAVDEHRIYVTGYSNGAVFSLLLWAKRAKTIAAVGEVAGHLDASETLTLPRPLAPAELVKFFKAHSSPDG
jgi:polyhydroxybutyrate depolymerase